MKTNFQIIYNFLKTVIRIYNSTITHCQTKLITFSSFKLLLLFLLLNGFAFSPASIIYNNFRKIASLARNTYSSAQIKFQTDLANLISNSNNKYKNIAFIQRDLQLGYIKKRTMQFNYLLDYKPEQINLSDGVSSFANFQWNDEDSKKLSNLNPDFAKLQNGLKLLTIKNDSDTLWKPFRFWFKDTCMVSTSYKTIMDTFLLEQQKTEQILRKYKK